MVSFYEVLFYEFLFTQKKKKKNIINYCEILVKVEEKLII